MIATQRQRCRSGSSYVGSGPTFSEGSESDQDPVFTHLYIIKTQEADYKVALASVEDPVILVGSGSGSRFFSSRIRFQNSCIIH